MKNGMSVAGTSADPTVRFAQLELDGEVYSLVFDFNAIATAEQIAKVNLLNALNFQDMTASQYRGLLYAALLKAHPDMTIEKTGALITLKRMPKISEALLQAWKNSLAPADEENPPQPVLDEAMAPAGMQ